MTITEQHDIGEAVTEQWDVLGALKKALLAGKRAGMTDETLEFLQRAATRQAGEAMDRSVLMLGRWLDISSPHETISTVAAAVPGASEVDLVYKLYLRHGCWRVAGNSWVLVVQHKESEETGHLEGVGWVVAYDCSHNHLDAEGGWKFDDKQAAVEQIEKLIETLTAGQEDDVCLICNASATDTVATKALFDATQAAEERFKAATKDTPEWVAVATDLFAASEQLRRRYEIADRVWAREKAAKANKEAGQ